jgi:hypothetical protein
LGVTWTDAERRAQSLWWRELAQRAVAMAASPERDPIALTRDAKRALTWALPVADKGAGEMMIAFVWACRAYGWADGVAARRILAAWLREAATAAGDFLDAIAEQREPRLPFRADLDG